MKLTKATAVLAVGLLSLAGCGEARNTMKHLHSSLTGLNRRIVLYDANGREIKSWTTTAKVEDNGGTCYFIDDRGKAVTISGTFIVQEQ